MIAALGRVGSSDDGEQVLDALSDPVPAVRAAAFRALAALDHVRFLAALSGLDDDRHWSVRAALAACIASLPPEEAAPLLEPLLLDADQRAVPAVIAALAAVKAPKLESILVAQAMA